jgi:16S rRNA (cytidine1402-2'-O)-methyltransferase
VALWIVATPIGTLGDLSPRAREVLRGAALVLAEDTRTARRLLTAVEIPAPPIEALHAHNEESRAEAIARRAGEVEVALVSDAGTPAVSDPGRAVVAACHALAVPVRSVPGPSALAAALAASGFPAAPSAFLGFPPRKGRDAFADEVLRHAGTVVIYEAPSRVPDLLARLAARDPFREGVVARELSKAFEEVVRAPLGVLAQRPAPRGECVVVVGPGTPPARDVPSVEAGASLKDVARVLADRWGVSPREAYQRLLEVEADLDREP